MDCDCDMTRREMIRRMALGCTGTLILWTFPTLAAGQKHGKPGEPVSNKGGEGPYYAYAVDTSKCIGCCACMRACRVENDVPSGSYRTWVERFRVRANGEVLVDVATTDGHVFGETQTEDAVKAFFVPKLCNHCEKSVCTQVCPVGASYHTPEGVVLVDRERCIGCGYCVQACPYGTRFINKMTHIADKCTLCYHRISHGELPACVQSCPKGARMFGNLNDPEDPLAIALKQRRFRLLKPEMGTHPKCYYLDLDFEVV